MKVSTYLAHKIKQHTNCVFTVPGGGCLEILHELKKSNVQIIPTLHEQSAVIAAESHAQYTGNLGVAIVTTGPGGTNGLTGVVSAWLDSVPVLLIAGQVQTHHLKSQYKGLRQLGFQEVDNKTIYDSVTKNSSIVENIESATKIIDESIQRCTTNRKGPCFVEIPLNIQGGKISRINIPRPLKKAKIEKRFDIKKVQQAFEKASRPILLIGNGVRLDGASHLLRSFLQKNKVPTLLTWKAIDLLEETHPCFVGRPGSVGQRGANINQQKADLFVSIGARLDHGQTAYNPANLAPKAKKLIVDIDKAELKKLPFRKGSLLNCNALSFLEAFNQLELPNYDQWLKDCRKIYLRYPLISSETSSPKPGYIDNYYFINRLSSTATRKEVFVPGSSGASSEITMQAFIVRKGVRILNSQGLGAMGFGLPAAIGCAFANRTNRIILIDGDGGFAMNLQELTLCKHYELNIKILILNNKGYGSIRQSQNRLFGGIHIGCDENSGLPLPDYQKISKAFGLPFIQLKSNSELNHYLKHMRLQSGPSIAEVYIDPNQTTLPKTGTVRLPDGSYESLPMDEMLPPIPKDELMEMRNL